MIREEFQTTFGVEKEVEKLVNTLTRIRAVLKDAEDKQLSKPSLKDWLRKLEDAAYDAEDILDEFSTEVRMWRNIHRNQRVSMFPFQKHIIIACRIKKMLTTLDGIDQERNKFQLVPIVPAETQNRAPPPPPPRTSLPMNRKETFW